MIIFIAGMHKSMPIATISGSFMEMNKIFSLVFPYKREYIQYITELFASKQTT